MRSLGRPFNQPSAESFIIEMYKIVDPIDNATPFSIFDGSETVFIETVNVGHPMDVQWFLDDVPIGLPGDLVMDLSLLTISQGMHTLSVDVVDPTPWVRDEVARDTFMKQRRSWLVDIVVPACSEDLDGNGFVDVIDLLAVVGAWGPCNGCVEDLDGNQVVNITDLLMVINAWGACP